MTSGLHFLRGVTLRMIPAVGFAQYSDNGESSTSKSQHNFNNYNNINLNVPLERSHNCYQSIPDCGNKFDKHLKIHNNSFHNLNNYLQKSSPSYNKLLSNLSSQKSYSALELQKTKERKDEPSKNSSNKTSNSSSTLSLHIAAYEAKIESEGIEKSSFIPSCKNKQLTQFGPSFVQNQFEFPRQQENNDATKPEVAQFTAGQKLINPNQHQFVSPFRRYYDPTPEQQIHNLRTEKRLFETENSFFSVQLHHTVFKIFRTVIIMIL